MYINDLPDYLTHRFKLYADDGKLTVELGADRDNDDIQNNINRITVWCETWFMELRFEKCKVMHLVKQSCTRDALFQIGNSAQPSVKEIKGS